MAIPRTINIEPPKQNLPSVKIAIDMILKDWSGTGSFSEARSLNQEALCSAPPWHSLNTPIVNHEGSESHSKGVGGVRDARNRGSGMRGFIWKLCLLTDDCCVLLLPNMTTWILNFLLQLLLYLQQDSQRNIQLNSTSK